MKTRIFWLLTLAAVFCVVKVAFADGSQSVTRGDMLKRRAYQTQGSLQFTVNDGGVDSRSCVGTEACGSIAAVISRLPKFICDFVDIDVDAGISSGDFNFTGFQGCIRDGGAGNGSLTAPTAPPVIRINGSQNWTTITPTTGSGTGTVSSTTASNTTTGAMFVVTDSTATWTAGDLKSYFFQLTSGAGATVTNKFPIVDNTATTITLSGTPTSIANGNTFAIQKPSTVLQPSTATGNGFRIRGPNTVTVMLNDVEIPCNASGTGWPNFVETLNAPSAGLSSNGFAFNRVRLTCAIAAAPSITVTNGTGTLTRVAATSARQQNLVISGANNNISISQSYFRGQVNNAATLLLGAGQYSISNTFVEGTGVTTSSVIQLLTTATNTGTTSIAFSGIMNYVCGGSTSQAIFAGAGTNPVMAGIQQRITYGSASTSNCASFITARGPIVVSANSNSSTGLTMPSGTNAFAMYSGAQLYLGEGYTYATTVTNALDVEGTAYGFGDVVDGGAVADLTYGTRVYR